MNKWPKQSECETYYGNPRDPKFESHDLINVPFPWMAVTSWSNERVKGALVHKKCADSLARIFACLWSAAAQSQDAINEWGLNKYGGAYCFRQMRGSKRLSMHSYGCAIDFDPARNAMGDRDPHFASCPLVLAAFRAEGWICGADWHSKDGMHFQAANL
jgi:hypothetical protein